MIKFLLFFILLSSFFVNDKEIKTGADQTEKYIDFLRSKSIAIVANQTSEINEVHLVDTLITLGIDVKKILTPEHGFRGNADAGEKISNNIDLKTGIPIISLYGKHKKPTKNDLMNIDILIFDIQDVGVRFYTYISTLNYVMEACAENNIPLLILDRPNPNIGRIDGPILESDYKSFIGMNPIPVLHGMTIAEYAKMINGEKWLQNGLQCDLIIINCDDYTRESYYELPIPPSPNLPNMTSIYLYPSLCFFEGTVVSIGRGTQFPFQQFGHPNYPIKSFSFTPKPTYGAKNPKLNGKKCFGKNLRSNYLNDSTLKDKLNLKWLIDTYKMLNDSMFFKNDNFFNLLAGTNQLKKQIQKGLCENEIRKSWQKGIVDFKKMREKYLIYD